MPVPLHWLELSTVFHIQYVSLCVFQFVPVVASSPFLKIFPFKTAVLKVWLSLDLVLVTFSFPWLSVSAPPGWPCPSALFDTFPTLVPSLLSFNLFSWKVALPACAGRSYHSPGPRDLTRLMSFCFGLSFFPVLSSHLGYGEHSSIPIETLLESCFSFSILETTSQNASRFESSLIWFSCIFYIQNIPLKFLIPLSLLLWKGLRLFLFSLLPQDSHHHLT